MNYLLSFEIGTHTSNIRQKCMLRSVIFRFFVYIRICMEVSHGIFIYKKSIWDSKIYRLSVIDLYVIAEIVSRTPLAFHS